MIDHETMRNRKEMDLNGRWEVTGWNGGRGYSNLIHLPIARVDYFGIFSEETHVRGVSVLRSLW